MSADTWSVPCPRCDAAPGQCCLTVSGYPCRPHESRARRTTALAAHTDPVLDGYPVLGPTSPCGLCGVPGMPQRHRVVDAIAEKLEAGDHPGDIADEHGVPVVAVAAISAWAVKWPGAWR